MLTICFKWQNYRDGGLWVLLHEFEALLFGAYNFGSLYDPVDWSFCQHISFLGLRKKFPQTVWLKRTEIYCFKVLEAKSLKLKCWLGHTPSKGSWKKSFPTYLLAFNGCQQYFQWLLMVGILWLVHLSLQSLPLLSHDILPVCLSVSKFPSSLIRIHIGLGLTLMKDHILTTSYVCKDPIPK